MVVTFDKFKETDYDLVCFGKKNIIVHYGIKYDFFKTLSNLDKSEYVVNILKGQKAPTLLLGMLRAAIQKMDWSKKTFLELITELEQCVIVNDFEFFDQSSSHSFELDSFPRESLTDDEIIEKVKSEHPGMNVRWQWTYRGVYSEPGEIVCDLNLNHAYKIKEINAASNGLSQKAILIDAEGNESTDSLNELVRIVVDFPSDDYPLDGGSV